MANDRVQESGWIDFICWNDECVGVGRWSVLVDAVTLDPLDDKDADCPTCGEEGSADRAD